ncbi:alpha/beta hydrolase [Streptomyces sp. NBC_00201]|uniref:alpha/beta fold hydrolase n=1 Tax=unclassified Streptomyces TaxID=2593676 RepID=UPI00224FBD7D|nr:MULTISPECIES: alpha/beta hydrolase [unclassified Streptomyces]MCX5051991.1 alpha/beta hydrolase [Streptomyces sp. NBC_00474]MCX5249886.1 alpha/beta hydrolase [Streptomyces sp. NBC_00201]
MRTHRRSRPAAGELPTQLAELGNGVVEFRLEPGGPRTVVVFYGGHMRAGLALGEQMWADADCSLLVPSRPGYGRTPVTTGGTASDFADVTAELCAHLGITEVTAVVGISGGGPTAVAMAARHPALGQRLILESAVGPMPWPDRRTNLGARAVFAPWTEGMSWAVVHALVRYAPDVALRLLLRDLTTLSVREVVARLRPEQREELLILFSRMRSGRGFLNDIADLTAGPDLRLLLAEVAQPSLVIASRQDRAVPFAHAQELTAALGRAVLVESRADSHLVWFADDWPAIASRVRDFLGLGRPDEGDQQ